MTNNLTISTGDHLKRSSRIQWYSTDLSIRGSLLAAGRRHSSGFFFSCLVVEPLSVRPKISYCKNKCFRNIITILSFLKNGLLSFFLEMHILATLVYYWMKFSFFFFPHKYLIVIRTHDELKKKASTIAGLSICPCLSSWEIYLVQKLCLISICFFFFL